MIDGMIDEKYKTHKSQYLVMMVGLPASGKSTYAEHLAGEIDARIFSSDAIRKELYGDQRVQGDPQQVFGLLHKRIREALNNGKNVIYDACNINKKRRMSFLLSLSKITRPFDYICVVMNKSYSECLFDNEQRDFAVPQDVITRMYKNWNPPHCSEGFDIIRYEYCNKWMLENTLVSLIKKFENFKQYNQYHTLNLGDHLRKTAGHVAYSMPNDTNLIIAALLHDCGKPFCQTFTNKKGEYDGNCHYYQHHCVGAYDAMNQLSYGYSDDDIADITNLIFYHMRPLTAWQQSKNALKKDEDILGKEFIDRLLLLNQADLLAH